jgi:hypothetical protein
VAVCEQGNGLNNAGEAQKIDRIMQIFADSYCVQNPDQFR